MKVDTSKEQLFIADVEAFDFIAHDLQCLMQAMNDRLAQCRSALVSARLAWPGLDAGHPLARDAEAVNAAVGTSLHDWTEQWQRLEPALALSESFEDKLVLLVYGKFNAGKSSFCNLLADRFRSHGKSVEYFYLEAGHIVATPQPLMEGVTETTSRLQGVRLGGKLVLVDTPGLHSVRPENAALTQLFINSADAVLWLTSSTSPGQVQELDELGQELRRNKPLLPVLTRSDLYDEDEIDGAIVKVLRNKTPVNRAEQEVDVRERAAQKLSTMGVSPSSLKPPVSVSSFFVRQHGHTMTALAEAGFEQLYAALIAIIEPTLAYKRRKQAEVFLHHLDESVMGALNGRMAPLIANLRASIEICLGLLDHKRDDIANAMWRAVVPMLPDALDTYCTSGEQQGLMTYVSQALHIAHAKEVCRHLHGFKLDLSDSRVVIDLRAAFDGMASCDSDRATQTNIPAAHDYQRLYDGLKSAVYQHILSLSQESITQCHAVIRQLDEFAARFDASLWTCEASLRELAVQVRSASA